ncbi:MAG TPA: phage holin family protein [Pseudonocardia sp.]
MTSETQPPTGVEGLPTGELVTRLANQVSALVRGELELARTELTAKGKRVGAGAGLAGAAGVIALYGLGALITAAIAALSLVWPVWLAALVIGVVVLIVAGGLALAGRSQIRRATPAAPEQTVQSVRDDVTTVREAVRR